MRKIYVNFFKELGYTEEKILKKEKYFLRKVVK